jgi:hypothetical protein
MSERMKKSSQADRIAIGYERVLNAYIQNLWVGFTVINI